MAGIVGVDPGPFTLRELAWMASARRQDHWSHTAALMALVANVHRNPKKRAKPFSPADFHPLIERKPVTAAKTGIRLLKRVFVDPK